MATFEITVAATIEVPDEYVGHPLNGPVAIAEQYALMATNYASIGATTSRVVCVQNINTLEILS